MDIPGLQRRKLKRNIRLIAVRGKPEMRQPKLRSEPRRVSTSSAAYRLTVAPGSSPLASAHYRNTDVRDVGYDMNIEDVTQLTGRPVCGTGRVAD